MTITIPPMSPFPGRGAAPEDYIAQADTTMQELPRTIAAMNAMSAALNVVAGVGNLGYLPPVAYAAGIAMTVGVQQVQYGDVTYAPLLDALPFNTSGVFETDKSKFRVIQGVVTADLSVADGANKIGYPGVGRTVDGALGRLELSKKCDLTHSIQTDAVSVLFTGDSTQGNCYQFTTGLTPGDWVYKNPYGLASWSHMLRDTIYASTLPFSLAKNVQIEFTAGVSRYDNVNPAYTVPFNGQLETFLVASAADEIAIRTDYINPGSEVRLLFFTGNSAFSNIAKFDVYANGVLKKHVSLAGDDNFYRGRYQLAVDVPTGTTGVTLKNIVCANGQSSPAAVQFIGYTAGKVDINMTGHGGWTSGQVLANFDAMIGQYSPDKLFLIIGANDLGTFVPPAVTKANVQAIIEKTRALKPNADIVLITTTPMDEFPKSGVAGQQVDALYQLAVTYGCFFADLFEVFKGIPTAYWRIDNVHMTMAGGGLLYQYMMNLVFPSMRPAAGYIPRAEYQLPSSVPVPAKPKISWVTIELDSSGTPLVQPEGKLVLGVSVDSTGEITVLPINGIRIIDVKMVVRPPAQYYMAQVRNIAADGSWTMTVMNMLAGPPALVTAKSQLANTFIAVAAE